MTTSGVFEISASNVPPLTQLFPLDQNGVLDKQTIFHSLVSAFSFPDYFGYNWDAAFDCLLDCLEQCDYFTDIYFSVSDDAQVVEHDFLIFTQLLQDVCQQKMQQQKAVRFFIVFNKLKGDSRGVT